MRIFVEVTPELELMIEFMNCAYPGCITVARQLQSHHRHIQDDSTKVFAWVEMDKERIDNVTLPDDTKEVL